MDHQIAQEKQGARLGTHEGWESQVGVGPLAALLAPESFLAIRRIQEDQKKARRIRAGKRTRCDPTLAALRSLKAPKGL